MFRSFKTGLPVRLRVKAALRIPNSQCRIPYAVRRRFAAGRLFRLEVTILGILGKLPSYAMNRPVSWVAGFVLVTGFFSLGLGRLQIRTEGSAIYPTGNQVIRQTEEDQRVFENPQELVLFLSIRNPENSFASTTGLRFLRQVHESLEEIDGLHPLGVFSLARLPGELPERIKLPLPTLLDRIPGDSSGLEALLRRIGDDPVAHGLFLSPDGDAAAIYVNFATDRAPGDVISALQSWIDSQVTTGCDMYLLGPIAAETTLGAMVMKDLSRLIPIMVAVVALLLLLFLRSPAGVIIPMAGALFVLLWVFGAMGYCGAPVTLLTTVLPVVLMAMGITDEIHLLERFHVHLAAAVSAEPGGPDARARIRDAMLASFKDVGWPIIATSLTTALAFLSFLSASIGPVREFGLFASVGILLAMLFTFTFIPALAVLLPLSWFRPYRSERRGYGFGTLFFWEKRAARQSGRAWLVGLLLVVLGLPGIRLLTVQDSWVGNFDPDSPLRVADRRFNEEFWGSYRYDVVFTGERRRFFYQPEGVALMEEFTRIAEEGPHVGGVLSYLIPIGEVADTFDYARPISSLSERKLYSLRTGARLAMGTPFMRLLVTNDASSARARIFVNRADYKRGLELEEYLETHLSSLSEGSNVEYHFSGELPAAVEVVRGIVTDQLRSIGWTLLGIAVLLLLALRTIRGALVVLVPVLAADWILFAGLGYTGTPIGIATSMFASLTIGIGIDYAIHIRHRYRRSLATERDHTSALVGALESAGRAIRWNAFALGIGFLVLGFSGFPPNRALGILLSSAMLTCYGTTLLLLPRLLRPTPPPGPSRRSP